MRRLRGDRTAEVGVFEDLQALLVIVVGIAVLIASALYNWGAVAQSHEDQELYDAVEDLLAAFEASNILRAVDMHGLPTDSFMLDQRSLASYSMGNNTENFLREFKSDFPYNVTFDDLDVPDGADNKTAMVLSAYKFGEPPPGEGVETVALKAQYVLVMLKGNTLPYDDSERHICLVTVVMWR
jgi:hypothetical protein